MKLALARCFTSLTDFKKAQRVADESGVNRAGSAALSVWRTGADEGVFSDAIRPINIVR